MRALFKKAAVVSAILIMVNGLFAFLCIQSFLIHDPLQPASESVLPWTLETLTDAYRGGDSQLSIQDTADRLQYRYRLATDVIFPSVTLVLAFDDMYHAQSWADLSEYSSVQFRVKCKPNSVLKIILQAFDERVTDTRDFPSYIPLESRFSCGADWAEIEVDLRHLSVPMWWLQQYQLDVTDTRYSLKKVIAISIDNPGEGAVGTPVDVTIDRLTLRGHDGFFIWFLVFVSVCLWSVFVYWYIRQYTSSLIAEVKNAFKQDKQFIAYQQRALEPLKDRQKEKLLHFMNAEYSNPGMSLDYAIAQLGLSRARIYEMLRKECNLTFSEYLNQLRLADAAKRLVEKPSATVTEIAYAVGYNNVSYFNRLFKRKYSCTAKRFREIYAYSGPDQS